jgi:acyl transferase domain-containing protein
VLEEAGRWTTPNHVSSYRKLEDFDNFFADEETTSKQPFTLVLSANEENSIRTYAKALHSHLMNPNVKVKLPDLAYTLSERRTHHFHRGFVVANRSTFGEGAVIFGKKNPEPPRIGFVFTGQGAQWSQMGKQLVDTFPQARKLLQYLDSVLQKTPTPPCWSILSKFIYPCNATRLTFNRHAH